MLSGNPLIGRVDWGDLRRTNPFCRDFGSKRGLPVDRYYIERFLGSESPSIRGKVLEIGEDTYTRRFGGDQVKSTDVLHVSTDNPMATIVADLQDAPQIPDESFDCVIFAQTLQYIYRPLAAVRTLHRILRPGGSLLLTVPGITQIASKSQWADTWYWSFTAQSVGRLLSESFSSAKMAISTHGNVLAATAQLQGLAASELTSEELGESDPDYQVIIAARAEKDAGSG